MNLQLVGAIGLVIALAGSFYLGTEWTQREWDAAVGRQNTEAAQLASDQRRASDAVSSDQIGRAADAAARAAVDVPDIVARCLGVRPVPGSAAADRAGMPAGAGMAPGSGGADAATVRWCEQLGRNYRLGLENTARAEGCQQWVCANGGCKG